MSDLLELEVVQNADSVRQIMADKSNLNPLVEEIKWRCELWEDLEEPGLNKGM